MFVRDGIIMKCQMSWEAFPLVLFDQVQLKNKTHEYTNSRNVWFGGLNQYDVKGKTKA